MININMNNGVIELTVNPLNRKVSAFCFSSVLKLLTLIKLVV